MNRMLWVAAALALVAPPPATAQPGSGPAVAAESRAPRLGARLFTGAGAERATAAALARTAPAPGAPPAAGLTGADVTGAAGRRGGDAPIGASARAQGTPPGTARLLAGGVLGGGAGALAGAFLGAAIAAAGIGVITAADSDAATAAVLVTVPLTQLLAVTFVERRTAR